MKFSIFNLRQLTAEQFKAGREKRSRAAAMQIQTPTFRNNPFPSVAFFIVSGYLVARLGFGVWCECKNFRHGRGDACKHIAEIMPSFCDDCRTEIDSDGQCRSCGIENALYLKPTSTRKREKIGNIVI